MKKSAFILPAVLILTAVILGAFGAHGLESLEVGTEKIDSFNTGIRYQFYTGFGLFALRLLPFSIPKRIDYFILIGGLLFSLSIYLLVLLPVTGIEQLNSVLGPLTPLGGLAIIVGWSLFVLHLIQGKKQ